MAGKFGATVTGWCAEKTTRMTAVRRESVQRFVDIMQTPVEAGGNLPVDTGFLRASLVAEIGAVSFSTRPAPAGDAKHSYNPAPINLVIAGASVTETISVAYTAVYARIANYGGQNRAARQFVGLAVQRWPQIVNEVAAEAERRNRK